MEYVRHLFHNAKKTEGGASIGDHLEQIKKTMAELGKELPPSKEDQPPPFPYGCEFILDAFQELHRAREGTNGIDAVSFQSIESWSRLNRVELLPFEVNLIRKIDIEYMKSLGEEQNNGRSDRTGSEVVHTGTQRSGNTIRPDNNRRR